MASLTWVRRASAVLVVGLALTGCTGSDSSSDGSAPDGSASATDAACAATAPEELRVEVVRSVERGSDSYTQGLVVVDGRLFESGGRYGESTLRELDPDTLEELRRADLDDDLFAEGLAGGGDGELVQLTWKEGVALVWNADTFEIDREVGYEGEGWGLTTLDDGTLVMSDGSDTLVERDPEDFSITERATVQRQGGSVDLINELDWDGESVWANQYRSDELLRIDPECWTVTGVADLAQLRDQAESLAEERGDQIDVTNGVAHLPGTDHFLVTGKWWPVIYEVRFVPT